MGGGRKSLTARHREAIVLLTGAGGTFGLICGFFGMLDWLKVDLEWLKACLLYTSGEPLPPTPKAGEAYRIADRTKNGSGRPKR